MVHKSLKINNSHGYTLVELIIYSVIALIVIGFSLSLIRTTSVSYTRDRRKSRMQTEGRNAILMMAREIVNTGFKTYLKYNVNVDTTLTTIDHTTTGGTNEWNEGNPDGESSFMYYAADAGNYNDSLEIFKANLDNNGQNPVQERIKYFLDGNILKRTRKEYTGAPWGNETTIELADNIEALQFRFSQNKYDWNINNPAGIKKTIQAIRIYLLIRTNKETDFNIEKTYDLGNGITISPTGDRYLRRLYIETVEVVNNGT